MTAPTDLELNAIGVLKRRAIEARIIAPLYRAFAAEVGAERARAIVSDVIVGIARAQGALLAGEAACDDLTGFASTLEHWTAGGALEMDVLASSSDQLHFNVTRCKYAELYRSLGIPELGAVLSCNRDAALIEGFNPAVQLTRTQTLMEGASCCDFRYQLARATKTGDSRESVRA